MLQLIMHAELDSNMGRHSAILDIGCNKGYFSLMALNSLTPAFGNQLEAFSKSHTARGVYTAPCGFCDECKVGLVSLPPSCPARLFCSVPWSHSMLAVTSPRHDLTWS